jgi:hypothetical protein
MLEVRALLVAVLLIGSTGSVRCQALCAELAAPQPRSHVEVAAPDHGGCHGGSMASLQPLSGSSRQPCEQSCCTVLTHATVSPDPISGPASAASPMLAWMGLGEACTRSSDSVRRSRPADLPKSPFLFQNPPLLL